MARKTQIVVRVSILEHKRYNRICKDLNLTMSEFIRQSFSGKLEPRLKDIDRELLRQLIFEVNKWQNITNMFRKKDPKLSKNVEELVSEMREIIMKNFEA